jgi:heme exporter protein B
MRRATPGQIVLVARRELSVERASWRSTSTVLPFTLAAMLLAGLAVGPGRDVLAAAAPGIVWLVVLLAAVPLARAVSVDERSDDAWDLLRSLVPPTAIAAGKLIGIWLVLLATWSLAAVLAVAGLAASWPPLSVLVAVLGTLGLAATLVLMGAVLGSSSSRQGALATLVLVAGLPAVVAGSQSATDPDPLRWLVLVTAWDALTLTVLWACFPLVLEE